MAPPVIAVVGPTAAGKSGLAIDLARALDGEIVNADSMQLYAGMDIGTAKLPPDQRGGVPHHLLDIWDITQAANVADYQRLARAAVDDIRARGRVPILVGGSGPIIDMVNNFRVHDIILGFYKADKLVGAECYGVPCLAFARDQEDRRSIIRGKHVTGHCIEYDYKDGTGFMGTDFNMGPPPYPLEYILRDATAPGGQYHGNFGKPTSVIVDYPFVTGRSTPDAYLTGQKMVEVLENGLRRWGFEPSD